VKIYGLHGLRLELVPIGTLVCAGNHVLRLHSCERTGCELRPLRFLRIVQSQCQTALHGVFVAGASRFEDARDSKLVGRHMLATDAEIGKAELPLRSERTQQRCHAGDEERAFGSAEIFLGDLDRNLPRLGGAAGVHLAQAAEDIERDVFDRRESKFSA
jgi:hypothetical protein